jgi:hypothetical protein
MLLTCSNYLQYRAGGGPIGVGEGGGGDASMMMVRVTVIMIVDDDDDDGDDIISHAASLLSNCVVCKRQS